MNRRRVVSHRRSNFYIPCGAVAIIKKLYQDPDHHHSLVVIAASAGVSKHAVEYIVASRNLVRGKPRATEIPAMALEDHPNEGPSARKRLACQFPMWSSSDDPNFGRVCGQPSCGHKIFRTYCLDHLKVSLRNPNDKSEDLDEKEAQATPHKPGRITFLFGTSES